MASSASEEQLLQLIMLVSEGEKEVEQERILLSEDYEFAPHQIFDCLDSLKRGSVSPRVLKDLLSEANPAVSDSELYLLIRQYSSFNNGTLNFDEFLHLVLPATKSFLWDLIISRSPRELSQQVEDKLVRLILKELDLQKAAEAKKQEIYKEISGHIAFSMLDVDGKGMISLHDLKNFASKLGKVLTDDLVDALLRRVNVEDKMFISYSELVDFILPVHFTSSEETKEEFDTPKKEISESEKPENEGKNLFNLSPAFENFVNIQVMMERQAELLRQNLVLSRNFSIRKAFEMVTNSEEISIYNLQDFLNSLNIENTRSDLRALLDRYGKDSKLDISSFTSLLVPKNPDYSSKLNDREVVDFDDHSMRSLQELLEFLIHSERALEKERGNRSINPKEVFESIDTDNDGLISPEEMNAALDKAGLSLNDIDLFLLLNKYDNEIDKGISLEKFSAEVNPKFY